MVLATLVATALSMPATATAAGVEDFYKGRTVSLVVGYSAGTGYDMATGLGSPNGGNLARALCTGGGAANTVTVTNPGSRTTTVGATVSLQATATDSGGAALTFSATSLPPGLSISASGLISGTPSAAGTYPVEIEMQMVAAAATEVDNGRRRRCQCTVERSNDVTGSEVVERRIEQCKGRTLARAVERTSAARRVPPLDVGRRQRAQRACDLRDAQVRQVPPFECGNPFVKSRVGVLKSHIEI